MIISITKHNFKQEIEQATKPVVIDVYATWCGPCQHMMPTIEKLAQEMGDKYIFAKVNVDESREIATEFGVSSVPTLIFMKDSQIVGSEVGYMSEDDLRDKIKEYLG